MPQPTVLVLGTCDTKLQELLFLKNQIKSGGSADAILLDVGRVDVGHEGIDIPRAKLMKEGLQDDDEKKDVSSLPRGEVIKFMAKYAGRTVRELYQKGDIHGVVSAGGSGGTSLAAEIMKGDLPIGFPKMIVSTVASGDTGPIVGETDITMTYSVVDVAGLNHVLRDILSNAGAAIGAMAQSFSSRQEKPKEAGRSSQGGKKRVGITMFGVTTPGVDAIRQHLESNYDNIEVYVFHATGHGGKAMERLVREGGGGPNARSSGLDAVLDLTTTEICDLVTGGVMSAGPERLEAAAQAGIPYIVSVGATDMSNFGPKDTVPERYRDRRLYEHNPVVTLMRSSREESEQVGQFIVDKLTKHAKNPQNVQVFLPLGGVSMIATPGAPFADQEADEVLFSTIRRGLDGSGIRLVEDERDVNDEGFARDIAEALVGLMGLRS